ncbi:exodeoxyribonuclease VII large subunit [Flavobacterium beibuense]|uniref:Exodeoxyribonuclease VII large subunit n=1 Tax=Flavobacterium beibuense TaxID=657326 RepID=A0A444WEJ0_9FLAO|nr:exodeoxyribonuclease VII large subunit [Flavobacterium beibuense]RYJ44270.1 Exodeoxyribonuclease VII large subunit [Flavobacterium beibuense]
MNTQVNHPIRLSQLTQSIASTLEDAFREMRFWVIADITSHSYKADKQYHNFELVEKDPRSNAIIAKINGKAWGNGSLRIAEFENTTGQRFTNNLQVLLQVSVEYHPLYGLAITLLNIDSSYTLGQLEQQRNATLRRLVLQNEFIQKIGEAYITDNNRLKLNPVVQRIALISSSISAGAEDFRHTLENNSFGYAFKVDDYFATVQGDKNAGLLLEKLIAVYDSGIRYDAVVITRGGGAQTDFLIFDNYRIARAAAKFPIPIITGIGHQKNQSITDMMVHTPTKTPTKAAEFIIAHNRSFEERLFSFQKDIIIASQQLITVHGRALIEMRHNLANTVKDTLSERKDALVKLNLLTINATGTIFLSNSQKLHVTANRLTASPLRIMNHKNNGLGNLRERISTANAQYNKNRKRELDNFTTLFKMISPRNLLKKGYAIIKLEGKVISNPEMLEPGMKIDVILSQTALTATIQNKTDYDGTELDI